MTLRFTDDQDGVVVRVLALAWVASPGALDEDAGGDGEADGHVLAVDDLAWRRRKGRPAARGGPHRAKGIAPVVPLGPSRRPRARAASR